MSHPTAPADSHAQHDHGAHAHGIGGYIIVFFALMFLMFATVGAAYVNMGALNVPVAYTIAIIKAVLILWFFMHLNQSTKLVQVFAFASFAWLALMLIVTFGDYLTRNWLMKAEEHTHIRQVDSYPFQSGQRQAALPGELAHHEGGEKKEAEKGEAGKEPAKEGGQHSTENPAH